MFASTQSLAKNEKPVRTARYLMDPNRNNLSFLLSLPTKRLLAYYRSQLKTLRIWELTWGEEDYELERLGVIKEELAKRENV